MSANGKATLRLGVDIGGTFTDAVLLDEETGDLQVTKVLTTPHDPAIGFLNAIDRIAERGSDLGLGLSLVLHATTVATNALIEGKGDRVGLIVTAGFRDILEIQRQIRPALYDTNFLKPPPLVPRDLVVEVHERLNARGEVITPLVADDVRRAAGVFNDRGVRAVAVCLLHSYQNPAHERAVGELLAKWMPEARVSLSHAVVPEIREYPRASTTVINAMLEPMVAEYVQRLRSGLDDRKLYADILVMQSSGGVASAANAAARPVNLIESGPAAGVVVARFVAAAEGANDVISFDVGGTTAKAGIIRDGKIETTKEFEVGGAGGHSRVGLPTGGGYPIRTPVIDLVEIGSGGGSIAWIDDGGVLRVGPRSAGADPGPACYGAGGTHPTVTDANVVLGRLSPNAFLGGSVKLDAEAAEQAITRVIAEPLGMEVIAAAHGIVEIANAAMAHAIRSITVHRGHDVRAFDVVAFGGGGPAHINRVMQELGARRAIIPRNPGVASALGLLVTDLAHEASVTRIGRAGDIAPETVAETLATLEREALATLSADRISLVGRAVHRYIEMRYVGQSYELPVLVPEGAITDASLDAMTGLFHEEHRRAYGRSALNRAVELVTYRVIAVGVTKDIRLTDDIGTQGQASLEPSTFRPVCLDPDEGFATIPIYQREHLPPGTSFVGPAIIEEADSTTILLSEYQAAVAPTGNLILERMLG